jgi:hypothetical protein
LFYYCCNGKKNKKSLHTSDVRTLHHPSLGRSSSNLSKNGGKRKQLSRLCYGKRFDNFVEKRKDARTHTHRTEIQFWNCESSNLLTYVAFGEACCLHIKHTVCELGFLAKLMPCASNIFCKLGFLVKMVHLRIKHWL